MAKKEKVSTGKKVAIGAAALGLVAAAAGIYLLKTNPKAKAWAKKAKKDVLEGVKKMKVANEKAYQSIVKNVMKGYEKMKEVSPEDVEALTKELKGYWKEIQREVAKGKEKAVKQVKVLAKKAKAPAKKKKQ